MYFAPILRLLSVCGIPAGIAAAVVIVGWFIYASTVRRK